MEELKKQAESFVSGLAAKNGVNVPPEVIEAVGNTLLNLGADLLAAHGYGEALAKAQAAANAVKTEDQAEQIQRERAR